MKSIEQHISHLGLDEPIKLVDNSHIKEFQKTEEEKAKLKKLKAEFKSTLKQNK